MNIRPLSLYRARWGEGPVWLEGSLHYVDIEGKAVCSLDLRTGRECIIPVGQRVGFVVPRRGGGFVIGGDHGLFFWRSDHPTAQSIIDPEPNLPDNRFNDGKSAPDGFLFAGTISLSKQPGAASLYRLSPGLHCTAVVPGVTNSNGLAWSLDGSVCYYIDTPLKKVWRFDYGNGVLANRTVAFATDDFEGSPDGMCIDADGMLWIAFCHGGQVVRFDPDTGAALLHIQLPCKGTTSVAFGGDDFATLFVTTGLYPKDPHPDDGRVFAIDGLPCAGMPAHCFAG